MQRRTVETLIALVVIGGLFWLLMARVILVTEEQRPVPPRDFGPVPVGALEVTAGVEIRGAELAGSLAPLRRLALSAETGGRVLEVLEGWRPGASVEADALLLRVDSKPAELALVTAKARLSEAKAALEAATVEIQAARDQLPILAEAYDVAARERARLGGLVDTGEASASMLDAALLAEKQAELARQSGRSALARATIAHAVRQAGLVSAAAAVAQAADVADRYVLRAPFAGLLTTSGPELSSLVLPGAPLGELVDLSSLLLLAQAHESQLSRVSRGAAVEIRLTSRPNLVLHGRVRHIAPVADPLTRSFTIEVLVEQPEAELLPAGLSARCVVTPPSGGRLETGVSIERGQFVWFEGRPLAFVMSPDGTRAEPRALRLGEPVGEGFVVEEGLAAGELLIVEPLDRLDPTGRSEVTRKTPSERP